MNHGDESLGLGFFFGYADSAGKSLLSISAMSDSLEAPSRPIAWLSRVFSFAISLSDVTGTKPVHVHDLVSENPPPFLDTDLSNAASPAFAISSQSFCNRTRLRTNYTRIRENPVLPTVRSDGSNPTAALSASCLSSAAFDRNNANNNSTLHRSSCPLRSRL